MTHLLSCLPGVWDSSVPMQNSLVLLIKGRCATARILFFVSAASISFGTAQKAVVLVTRSDRGWHGTHCARQYLQTLKNLGIALDGRKRALCNIMAAVPVPQGCDMERAWTQWSKLPLARHTQGSRLSFPGRSPTGSPVGLGHEVVVEGLLVWVAAPGFKPAQAKAGQLWINAHNNHDMIWAEIFLLSW